MAATVSSSAGLTELTQRINATIALHTATHESVSYGEPGRVGQPTYTTRCNECSGVFPCKTRKILEGLQ
jgi:hypothetical protein